MVAQLANKTSVADSTLMDLRKANEVLAAEKAALEEELASVKGSLEDVSNQLRNDADAYGGRVRGLNERAAELRDKCNEQELTIEALREEVKAKEVS